MPAPAATNPLVILAVGAAILMSAIGFGVLLLAAGIVADGHLPYLMRCLFREAPESVQKPAKGQTCAHCGAANRLLVLHDRPTSSGYFCMPCAHERDKRDGVGKFAKKGSA